jgi:hypothetical protein
LENLRKIVYRPLAHCMVQDGVSSAGALHHRRADDYKAMDKHFDKRVVRNDLRLQV